jgi:hypothetical protein
VSLRGGRLKPITYISFGAGVQSTALLVMSNLGLNDCPRADVAIFADTGDEPSWVYRNLAQMKGWSETTGHRIPVKVVQEGHLSADVLDRHKGQRTRFAAIPAFTTGSDGRAAPLRRQCTREYKIKPIERRVRELCGLKKGERAKGVIDATAMIGISLDEATRMKPSRTAWVTNRYPLVEAGLRRDDCLRIVSSVGLDAPQKSSCLFCPYHSDEFWRRLKKNHPDEFSRTADFDEGIRNMSKSGVKGQVFLHRSLTPLRELDFDAQGRLFPDLEDEECEGGCFL